MFRQVKAKLSKLLRSLHRRKNVDEIIMRQQPSSHSLCHHAVDGDFSGRDSSCTRHRVNEGGPDTTHIVVEGACGGVERDDGGDPFGVRALEARVAPTVEEGGAPQYRAGVRWTVFDQDRAGAVAVGWA